MATYTITLNERTSTGKALMAYLEALGVLVSKVTPKAKSSYLRSQEDKQAGRVEKFSSSEEMFKSLGIWTPMYEIRMTKTFRKDTERCRKRGYDMELLKGTTQNRHPFAWSQRPTSYDYHPHKLSGQYGECWECHLKPDWLLIWEQNDTELTLLFTGTGTHSDLFWKNRK